MESPEKTQEPERNINVTRRQQKIAKRKEALEKAQQKNESNLEGTGIRMGAREDPEDLRVDGQVWYVFSFVAPAGSAQRAKSIFIKFRGAFPTPEDADEHAQKVRKIDPDVDIFIFKAGAWIQVPPPAEHYESVPMKYMQDKMDKIMEGYYAQARRAKAEVDARMRKAKAEAAKKNKHIKEKLERARQEREKLQSAGGGGKEEESAGGGGKEEESETHVHQESK